MAKPIFAAVLVRNRLRSPLASRSKIIDLQFPSIPLNSFVREFNRCAAEGEIKRAVFSKKNAAEAGHRDSPSPFHEISLRKYVNSTACKYMLLNRGPIC